MNTATAPQQPWTTDWHFPRDAGLFASHFPSFPTVPGSLVIAAALAAAREAVPCPTPLAVERFRFMRFMPPGRYRFLLLQDPDRAVLRCTVQDADGRETAHGVLTVGDAHAR